MRKAWRVDLKWMFGIIFTIGCFLALNAYFLLSLSSPSVNRSQPGNIKTMESSSKTIGIPEYPNNPANDIFKQVKANPEQNLQIPLIGEIKLKGKDINRLSSEEAMKKVEKAVDKKIQNMPDKELQKMFKDFPVEGISKKFSDNPGNMMAELYGNKEMNPLAAFDPMTVFGSPVLSAFAGGLLGFGLTLALIGFAGLLFASYRSGKLVSPGICLMIAAFPGTVGYAIGKSFTGIAASGATAGQQPGIETFIVSTISNIIDKGLVFPYAFGIGVLFIVTGLIVGIIIKTVRHKPSPSVSPPLTAGNQQIEKAEGETEKNKETSIVEKSQKKAS